MKRSRKTLFALLLALVMTLGLAATAWAAEEVPTDTKPPFEKELSITKVVEKTGDVTPPAETFTFVLEDGVKEGEKHPPAYYGITLMDDLKISTAAGTGTFEKTFKFKLPASDFDKYHWTSGTNVGSNEIARYYKSFLLREKNDGKAGWQYSTKEYAVTFEYDTKYQTMDLSIHTPGNDDYSRSAEFKNTYTGTTVAIPFTKTVKLGGNTAPGKTDFTLKIFDIRNSNENEYKDVTYTAAVTTNGAGNYEGKLIISGPATQVDAFISEGFFVREEKGNLSGWTYSDAVWCVKRVHLESGSQMQIYPAKMEKTENGEGYVPDMGKPEDKMTFENIYTYSTTPIRREKPNTPEPAIASPKTFDAGVALYGVSALLSLAGTALVIKRKNG